jgi:hypothetical protein
MSAHQDQTRGTELTVEGTAGRTATRFGAAGKPYDGIGMLQAPEALDAEVQRLFVEAVCENAR